MGQMYFPGELGNDCSAEIEKIWVEHNESEDGEKGMRIHLAFDINGMLNKKVEISAYFYYATDNPLKDTNDRFSTMDGNVATLVYVYPPYNNSYYSDLTLFIPYEELHINRECACYFFIQIWNGTQVITTSKRVDFYASRR